MYFKYLPTFFLLNFAVSVYHTHILITRKKNQVHFTLLSYSSVMDCHATARGSIPGGSVVKTEQRVLHKGQYMGVPSLNDLAVDGT